MESFLTWLKVRGCKERTINYYARAVSLFQQWYEKTGSCPFDPVHVTMHHLQKWFNYLQNEATYKRGNGERKYSIGSVQTFKKALNRYFDYLEKQNVIPYNPTCLVPKIQLSEETHPRWLTLAERKQLIEYIETPLKNHTKFARNRAIIYLGLLAGLRRSQISALVIDNVDLPNRQLVLDKQIIKMDDNLFRAMVEWMDIREHNSGHVFLTQNGGPLTDAAIRRLCTSIGEKLRIPDFSPHVLRHTYGRDLAKKGTSLEDIANILGHANVNFARVYIRST